MTFSEQLHAIRAERGITQKQAYTELEIPRRTYEDWESGKRTPPAYLQKIVLKQLKK